MFTSTTGSLSSFQSSKASRSYTQRSTTTKSIVAPKPKPQPKPKPAPRPVLQFDSEDDLSFGDDSEEDDDFDLGGKKEEEEKDAGDVQKVEEKKKEVEGALSDSANDETITTEEKVVVPAPQDVLSKDVHDGDNGDNNNNDSIDNYDDRGLNLDEEVVDDAVEVVLQEEQSPVPQADSNKKGNQNDSDFEEDFSVDTDSIDDILGKKDEDDKQVDTTDNADAYGNNDVGEALYDDNNVDINHYDDGPENETLTVSDQEAEDDEHNYEDFNHYDDAPENETLTVSDQEAEDDFINELEQPHEVQNQDVIDFGSVAGNGETNGSEIDELDELDDVLNEDHEVEEPDDRNEPAHNESDNQVHERAVPGNVTESDDDISMGEDSLVDEDGPQETTHKLPIEEALSPERQQQERPEEPQEQVLPEEGTREDESQEQNLPEEDKQPEQDDQLGSMDFEPKDEMKKSNTLDSLDFILDASSTIAEEPEMEESEEELEEFLEEEGHPEEEEEELSLFADDDSYRSHFEDDEEYDEMQEESDFEGDDEPDMEEEPNDDSLPPLRYKLLISDKYHPEYGLEELYPEDLYLVDSLAAFEEGAISNQELAVLIIEALFERDFENGEHWDIDNGTARDLEEDEGGGGDLQGCAFVVKRQARLDWNDLYSVAAAKGTIIISTEKDEIKVENYSYFVAG